ncbi:protein disulfide isomerase MPD2 [Kluyveromyces marxianus]|uniref:Protein disulfide isomerase MPD2 n=2 Tax=Kluyveromyces marxianus TaxID=4911 RepID=W0TCP8_KLUMD|nr:protein disulfide isomerase MPD2 [Kluyveromyces marxianus DMKU3-1042]QGN15583.1 protein disulfide isomerase MPD2 [Kluyveromyces marxianus]BAO39869.1 protein disulfide isomerase MPD2 [Kluyveromyces marxianus DMKU3-1042]BAP71352.1 protein disulfide isomerase MPD2 [Kluyveromyces marxianus]
MKLPLFLLFLIASVYAVVESVTSLDQFYDKVNDFDPTNPRYVVVKYYTNWCHHCKKLKPVFEQLSESPVLDQMPVIDPALTKGSQFTFFEVECELFGSVLCSRLEGYPAVEVIKPLRAELDIKRGDEGKNWFGRVIHRILNGGLNPRWVLDSRRVVTFEGNRDLDVFERFLERVVEQDQWERLVDVITSDECPAEDDLCKQGREYYLSMYDDAEYEKKLEELEKEIAASTSVPKELTLKYQILNKIYELNHPTTFVEPEFDPVEAAMAAGMFKDDSEPELNTQLRQDEL